MAAGLIDTKQGGGKIPHAGRHMVEKVLCGTGSDRGSTATRKRVNHARGGDSKGTETQTGNVPKLQAIAWDVAPPKEFFDELFRVSKNQIIWGGNYFELPPTRCFLVWRKLSISESFSMAMAEYAWTSFNGNSKVFEAAPQGKKGDTRFHPTQKPVELYTWILRLFASEGMKIFDPMMGSQSSRVAAYKMGFDYWGCELDSRYFAKGEERFRRECLGIQTVNGETIEQNLLFNVDDLEK